MSVSTAPSAGPLEALWTHGRPAVMGIVNCTPDSFSDGGLLADATAAISHGERLLDEGADIVDIGGESTRPGAPEVGVETELTRVLPVITGLRRRRPSALISVDTTKAAVAEAALQAGADIVNDVSAAADPSMLEAARGAAALVLMHRRGTSRTMQQDVTYTNVVAEVHDFLRRRAAQAVATGLEPAQVWLDPGIGFGKDVDGNLALLAALPDLAASGHPVVVGPSRKSFIGRLTGAELGDRLPGTLASLLPALACTRAVVRVHDAAPARQFLEVAASLHYSPGVEANGASRSEARRSRKRRERRRTRSTSSERIETCRESPRIAPCSRGLVNDAG